MDPLYAIFFGAGVASFSYTKIGRRAGYGNTKNVITVVGVIFVLSSLFFFTVLKYLLNLK